MGKYETRLLQVEGEHDKFIELIKAEGVISYLEIGSMFGGSLWRVAHQLPLGSRVVSVDLPPEGGTSRPHLIECVQQLVARGYDAHLFLGDSKSAAIVKNVRALGPFDCVFIDGDHGLAGVTADWENYGPMGGIVAFHDISWWRAPGWKGGRIEVPLLWNKIKGGYSYEEIKLSRHDCGIGVLWH